jgi:hypothetical protein
MTIPKPLPPIEVLEKVQIPAKPNHNGYIYVTIPGWGIYPAHRVVWKLAYGKDPEHVIDHIDGNPANNNLENLRDVPVHMNAQNRIKTQKKYLGVVVGKRESRAVITRNGVIYDLGMFDTPEEARDAFLAAKKEYDQTGQITMKKRPSKFPSYRAKRQPCSAT